MKTLVVQTTAKPDLLDPLLKAQSDDRGIIVMVLPTQTDTTTTLAVSHKY